MANGPMPGIRSAAIFPLGKGLGPKMHRVGIGASKRRRGLRSTPFGARDWKTAELTTASLEFAPYHAAYYAAFLIDPEGNRVEAVCHTED